MSLSDTLSIDGYERDDGVARAGFTVTDAHRQPMGIVNGGALAALGEIIASRATNEIVNEDGFYAAGQTNETSFLRPISSGRVSGEGRARHRGRTTWVWEIEIRDDQDRLCALNRMTVAVRPIPASMRGQAGSEAESA